MCSKLSFPQLWQCNNGGSTAFDFAKEHITKEKQLHHDLFGVEGIVVVGIDEIDVAILTKPRVDKLVSEAKIVGGSVFN